MTALDQIVTKLLCVF